MAVPVDYSRTPMQLCDDILHHDFFTHQSTGYNFTGSTEKLRRILLGSWLFSPIHGLSRGRELPIWPKSRDGFVTFAAGVVEVSMLGTSHICSK